MGNGAGRADNHGNAGAQGTAGRTLDDRRLEHRRRYEPARGVENASNGLLAPMEYDKDGTTGIIGTSGTNAT
jgi:hypothetical protein